MGMAVCQWRQILLLKGKGKDHLWKTTSLILQVLLVVQVHLNLMGLIDVYSEEHCIMT